MMDIFYMVGGGVLGLIIYALIGRFIYALLDYQYIRAHGVSLNVKTKHGVHTNASFGRFLISLLWPIGAPVWFIIMPLLKFILLVVSFPIALVAGWMNSLHKTIVAKAYPPARPPEKSTGTPFRDGGT